MVFSLYALLSKHDGRAKYFFLGLEMRKVPKAERQLKFSALLICSKI